MSIAIVHRKHCTCRAPSKPKNMYFRITAKESIRPTHLSCIVLIIFSLNVRSQDILEKYISIGLENNQEVIRENLSIVLSRKKLEEAEGAFYPHIYLRASYSLSEGGRTVDIPTGDLLNPIHTSLNELLGKNVFPRTIPNVREQLIPNKFQETKLRFLQPIFNSSLFYNYKAKKAKISVAQARRDALENELIKQIKIAYYQFLSSTEKLAVLENTLVLLEDLVKLNQRRLEEGVSTKDVVLSSKVQVQRMKSQIAAAKSRVHSSRSYFNHLLNRDLQASVLINSRDTAFNAKPFVLEKLKRKAIENRKELQQMVHALEVNDEYEKLSKSSVLPEVSLLGDIGYQGFSYNLGPRQEFWFVQFNLTWDIFNGFRSRNTIQEIQIRREILESRYSEIRKKILLEVTTAYYELLEARESYLANLAELEHAKEAYRILLEKYQHNMILPLSLNEARKNYTNAGLRVVISQYDMKIKEAELSAAAHLI